MVTHIAIENKDGFIWDQPALIRSLIAAKDQQHVILDLLSEGPCCQTLGLDEILGLVSQEFDIDPNVYEIKTSNQLSSSQYREVRQGFVELEFVQDRCKVQKDIVSTLDKRFGIFISRSNWLRLCLASYLWMNYREQSLITYHYHYADDYHINNFGLEDAINRNWEDISQLSEFVMNLPIKREDHQYPILWNRDALDMGWAYRDIFCDIVCETYFSGRTFMMTEKIMRAIMFKRPFLVQGPKWYLRNLRMLGFKTFDQWWDEGYDEDPWNFKYQALKQNIDFIAAQTQETIKRWYEEMTTILEHNQQVLLMLKQEDITKTDFFYE